MITPEQIKEILEQKLKGADISVEDLTGASDHFEARVTWESFRGKGLIEQHQLVNQALSGPLEDGRIHALKIKTLIPTS